MKKRREWPRTEGYRILQWLTIPQTAVESSLRTFFRVITAKKPEKLHKSLYDEENDTIIQLSFEELENMTRLCRRSWRTRVLRYAAFLPPSLYHLNTQSSIFKKSLREWVRLNIPKDGDFIFQGKLKPAPSTDWMTLELESWKAREADKYKGMIEANLVMKES